MKSPSIDSSLEEYDTNARYDLHSFCVHVCKHQPDPSFHHHNFDYLFTWSKHLCFPLHVDIKIHYSTELQMVNIFSNPQCTLFQIIVILCVEIIFNSFIFILF